MDFGTRLDAGFELGLGTGGLREHEACAGTVERALELGYRHIDTARAYGNERAIGAAVERSRVERGDILIATKVHSENLSPDDVRAAVQASRDALGVDVVDIVYVHWPAHAYDPEGTLSTLADLRDDGAIRHVGLSNFTVDLVEEAREIVDVPIFAVQVEMHPFLRQDAMHEYAVANGIELVAHTPLCQGRVLENPVLSAIANDHDVSEAVVTLAWLLQRDRVAAVPSARANHLEQNRDALSITLSDREVQRIESIETTIRCVTYDFAPWEPRDTAN